MTGSNPREAAASEWVELVVPSRTIPGLWVPSLGEGLYKKMPPKTLQPQLRSQSDRKSVANFEFRKKMAEKMPPKIFTTAIPVANRPQIGYKSVANFEF